MFVIGIDVGSSGVKSNVFDEGAKVVSSAHVEYDMICQAGTFELDPNVIRKSAIEVLKRSVEGIDKAQVKAICATSFGESAVYLGEGDEVLCNTMMYMDTRGQEECKEAKEQLGDEETFDITGHLLVPMYTITRFRWLQKNRPELKAQLKKVCFIADFITYSLGAEHKCDYSLASRSCMLNVHTKQWWKKGVDFAMLDMQVLPEPVPSGSCVGNISEEIAQITGLSVDVKLIIGGHDQLMAAVGSGAIGRGDFVNGMGTSDCITAIMGKQDVSREFIKSNFCLVPFLDTDCYAIYAFSMSGGTVVKWFRDNLAIDLKHDKDAYQLLNLEAKDKPTGMIMLPYFAGTGTPDMDSSIPAGIVGMKYNTTRGDMFRAFLEGETYQMQVNLQALEGSGIKIDELTVVGGGASSSLWMQIRADIFGKKVTVLDVKEAGTLGSAILCYVNTGLYADVFQAQKQLIKKGKTYYPNSENVKIYKEGYKKYLELYKSVKGLYSLQK